MAQTRKWIFISTLVIVSIMTAQVESFIIASVNAGLKLAEHLLNPPRIFGRDKYEYALPDIIIKQAGYKLEVHKAVTPDGHILPLYRIPHGKGAANSTGQPVLLMPGIATSASAFLFLSPEKALPFILANEGYDVWIGNYRGCEATSHLYYSRHNLQYWMFGIDELGKYDVPTIVDYMLLKTSHSSINYIGYSMGTVMFFMSMSSKPEYNTKIRKMVGLAPGAYVSHTTSLLKYLKHVNPHHLVKFFDILSSGSTSASKLRESVSTMFLVCRLLGVPTKCMSMMKGFSGSRITNANSWIRATKHFPSAISARVMAQVAQILQTDESKWYDFGPEVNTKRYGSVHAPKYNYSKVTAECFLFNGPGDEVLSPKDVDRTFKELGCKNKMLKTVNRSDFNHVDFILDENVKSLVYNVVVEYLKK